MIAEKCRHRVLFGNLRRGENMAVSYKKLWKLLIDKDLLGRCCNPRIIMGAVKAAIESEVLS